MNRRAFIHIGVAGATSSIIVSKNVLANMPGQKINNSNMAGGVYYTKEAPGRWAKKAGSHSPIIQKTESGVRIVTSHPMKLNDHWIIKHVLLDRDFKFIAENIFDPEKDKAAMSSFKLSNQSDIIYALSVCNKHDTWLTALTI